MFLEIGCGDKPVSLKEWDHLDARPLPHIEFVQSAVDLSNIPDNRYDRVVASDVIEHLGWRDIPQALREWLRVLTPKGLLEIETPNAVEALVIIGAPGYGARHGDETQFHYFNRVMYGHQDYPENTHRSYFTPAWLTDLLYEAGASRVRELRNDLFRFRLEARK